MKIKFNTFDDVNKFVKMASNFQSDISVKSGRYVVDAKSIMGIYSFDLSKELDVEIIEKNSDETDKLIDKLRELNILAE